MPANFLFFTAISFLLIHEMDAVRCREWTIFPLLSRLKEETGYVVFTSAHIPLIFLILAGISGGGIFQPGIRAALDVFCIAHIALHVLFHHHPQNRFGTLIVPGFLIREVLMTAYILVSIIGGILFGVMDGLINANPLAVKLFEVFKPIAKTSINVPAGVIIDLVYGFVLAGLFLLLYPALPGATGLLKGISYALIIWFLRVAMSVISQWMMYTLPVNALLYTLLAGLGEMLVLGILYGIYLRPSNF